MGMQDTEVETETVDGSVLFPESEEYTKLGEKVDGNNCYLTTEDNRLFSNWGTVDHRVAPDGVIEEVNKCLAEAGIPNRFVNVNCEDDQFYFGLTDSERPTDKPLKDLLRFARDSQYSDEAVGIAFRARIHGFQALLDRMVDLPWDRPVDVRKLPDFVLGCLVERHSSKDYADIDMEEEERIIKMYLSNLNVREVFDQWLNFNGVIGYADKFASVLNVLFR